MIDLLTTALRELESDAPDPEATRDAVYEGIVSRARRRRAATIVAAVATVVGLAAGTYVVTAEFSAHERKPVANPPAPAQEMVELPIPELTMPISLRKSFVSSLRRDWEIGPGSSRSVTYGMEDDANSFSVTVEERKPPRDSETWGPPTHEDDITVNGHPAIVRVYNAEVPAQVLWQLPSGSWAVVRSNTVQRSKQVANAVQNRPIRKVPALTLGIAPPGYRVHSAIWQDGQDTQYMSLRVCKGSDDACLLIERSPEEPGWPGAGREPELTTKCNPDARGEAEFGKPRLIDGARIRLGSDGCFVLKVQDGEQPILLGVPERALGLTVEDLARMAATIKVRP